MGEVTREERGEREGESVRGSLYNKLCKISIPTSQRTQCVSISKINSLILFSEGKRLFSTKDHKQHIHCTVWQRILRSMTICTYIYQSTLIGSGERASFSLFPHTNKLADK